MPFLNSRQRKTLEALADTFAPALPEPKTMPDSGSAGHDAGNNRRDKVGGLFSSSASTLKLAENLEEALERASDEATRGQLKLFFALLALPFVNGIGAGVWKPFSAADLNARTKILKSWALSPFGFARRAFNGIKRLSLFLFYSLPGPDGTDNPAWKVIGYEPPKVSRTPDRSHIVPAPQKPNEVLQTEILVIGSGAGGGVVAGELSAAGYQVMVVEKGKLFENNDFPRSELEANEGMYEKYGALTTADSAISVLAGSTLGGGTTINWTGSLRTPDYVLDEWERDYGFEGVSGKELQDSFAAVEARMNIGTHESTANANTRFFEKGCMALGHKITAIPRNVKGCGDCGFCTFGCVQGAKQSTLQTYLADARTNGAQILTGAWAEKILHEGPRATGAVLRVQPPAPEGVPGIAYSITVKARAVVVAGGAIHTPALLLRSGLRNPNIGVGLRLHPTTFTTATFSEPVRAWSGAPMTRIMTGLANLDGRGYGVRLMNAPAHPGIAGFATPWISGAQHRDDMSKSAYKANIIATTRDFHGGRVAVDKHGLPVLHYKLHAYDAAHMMRGVVEALTIHRAAGASELAAPQNERIAFVINQGSGKDNNPPFETGVGRGETRDSDFDKFIRSVRRTGLRSNGFTLFSAHQMASCRVAGNNKKGAIDPSGESYDLKGLFVADSSVFPTCSGVNPMLSVLGVSHMLAQRIKTRLGPPG